MELTQLHLFARQIRSENSSEDRGIYKDVISKPHGCLLIDLSQSVNDLLNYRTNIFNSTFCYYFCDTGALKTNNSKLRIAIFNCSDDELIKTLITHL